MVQCVALSDPSHGDEDLLLEQRTTVPAAVGLFAAAVEAGARQLSFISSGGTVYGESSAERLSEHHPLEPVSPYGISKVTIEGYLRYFRRVHAIETASFRLSNPYGLRQSP